MKKSNKYYGAEKIESSVAIVSVCKNTCSTFKGTLQNGKLQSSLS